MPLLLIAGLNGDPAFVELQQLAQLVQEHFTESKTKVELDFRGFDEAYWPQYRGERRRMYNAPGKGAFAFHSTLGFIGELEKFRAWAGAILSAMVNPLFSLSLIIKLQKRFRSVFEVNISSQVFP